MRVSGFDNGVWYDVSLFHQTITTMKTSKRQITEITEKAIEAGINVNTAIQVAENCSVSIFKVIGIKGIIEAAKRTDDQEAAKAKGGVPFSDCTIQGETEKAYMMAIPIPCTMQTKVTWIAKSIIIDGVVPFWAFR